MPLKHNLAFGALVGATLAATGPASAQTAKITQQMDALQAQIQQLQQELQTLQGQVKYNQDIARQAQEKAVAAQAAVAAPPPAANAPHVTESSSHQFGLASADGKNTIELTGRYQMDYGDYVNYDKKFPGASPNDLNSGVNARRARIGVTGKFDGDWNYTLIYDFGGTSDTINPLASGTPASGIENGYIEYAGTKPFYVDLGYLDSPYTLDEAGSSNDIMFIERASSQVIAANIAAGDNRSVFGAHWNSDRLWLGAFVTGPTSGAAHTLSVTTLAPASSSTTKLPCPDVKGVATCTLSNQVYSAPYNGSAEQLGAFGRAAFQVLQTDEYTLHIGGDIEALLDPPHTSAGTRGLSLSDRPELRIDPTTLISTGTIANVSGAQVYSGEAAGNFGPFFVQGEYFDYNIDRDGTAPSLGFTGGYVEAAYTFTGESRKYNPTTGAYTRITPANPFEWGGDGFTGLGAWEIAGRYSTVDLNDKFTVVKNVGVEGGKQTVYSAAINWYPTANIRFDFDYLHGNVDKLSSAGAGIGQKFDAIALRSQFVW